MEHASRDISKESIYFCSIARIFWSIESSSSRVSFLVSPCKYRIPNLSANKMHANLLIATLAIWMILYIFPSHLPWSANKLYRLTYFDITFTFDMLTSRISSFSSSIVRSSSTTSCSYNTKRPALSVHLSLLILIPPYEILPSDPSKILLTRHFTIISTSFYRSLFV